MSSPHKTIHTEDSTSSRILPFSTSPRTGLLPQPTAVRGTPPTRHPQSCQGADLLPTGGAKPALVPPKLRCHRTGPRRLNLSRHRLSPSGGGRSPGKPPPRVHPRPAWPSPSPACSSRSRQSPRSAPSCGVERPCARLSDTAASSSGHQRKTSRKSMNQLRNERTPLTRRPSRTGRVGPLDAEGPASRRPPERFEEDVVTVTFAARRWCGSPGPGPASLPCRDAG
jgi:hypothetical protein